MSKYIYECCDVSIIVLLTKRFLDVAKFATLTPLSLLILCKLLSAYFGIEISQQDCHMVFR
jgi:hypothetical protein